MNSNLDALEWALKLSKSDRTKLSFIKTERELESFCAKLDKVYNKYIMAVVPALFHLQNYINKIDNECNIKEIFRNNNSTAIKNLRNVANFSRTMENFYSAGLFIKFDLGKDKCIAIRENENWNSPNIDSKIVPSLTFNEVPFANIKLELRKYIEEHIRELVKVEDETIPNDVYEKYKNQVDLKDFKWKPTKEQAYSIFEAIYGFDPRYSRNNGLHVIILELKESNFGQGPVPVHPIKNIENELFNAGISKGNSNPNLEIKILRFSGNTFKCNLLCNGKFLHAFNLDTNLSISYK